LSWYINTAVWVDGKGLVRRIAISIAITAAGNGGQVALQIDFLSFNASPPVSAPPSSQVYDLTGAALQGLSQLGR